MAIALTGETNNSRPCGKPGWRASCRRRGLISPARLTCYPALSNRLIDRVDSFDADLTPPVRDLAVSRLSLRTDMPANVGRLVAPSIQPRLCFSLRHGEPATTLIGCQPERKKIRMLHRKYFEKQRLK